MAWTTPRTWVAAELVTAAIGNAHWRDNLAELRTGGIAIASQAAGDVIYASTASQLGRSGGFAGPYTFGAAPRAQSQFQIAGSFAPADAGAAVIGLDVTSSITGTPGDSLYGTRFEQTLLEAASGNHGLIAGIYIGAPTITGAGATVTNAATVYVAGAPTVTVSGAAYALWVAAGTSKFGGDMQLAAASKFYLDGGGDTYILENTSNEVLAFAGGVNPWTYNASGFFIYQDTRLAAAKKFYLDGGGDSYLIESAGDNIAIFTGGSQRLLVNNAFVSVGTANDLSIEAAKKFYIDGGGDSYLWQASADDVRLVVGGNGVWQATAALFSTDHITLGGAAPATPVAKRIYNDSLVCAWVFFTNTGTPTISNDFNVASLTDNGTGDTTVNFATALTASNSYAVVVAGRGASPTPTTKAAGSVRIVGGADESTDVICVGS